MRTSCPYTCLTMQSKPHGRSANADGTGSRNQEHMHTHAQAHMQAHAQMLRYITHTCAYAPTPTHARLQRHMHTARMSIPSHTGNQSVQRQLVASRMHIVKGGIEREMKGPLKDLQGRPRHSWGTDAGRWKWRHPHPCCQPARLRGRDPAGNRAMFCKDEEASPSLGMLSRCGPSEDASNHAKRGGVLLPSGGPAETAPHTF